MTVAELGLSLTEYRDLAAAELYAGGAISYDDLDSGEQTEIDRLILRGERRFWLHPPGVGSYVWSCMRDPGDMDIWGDIAVAAAVTVTQSTTTMTASAATFYETMVGKSVIVTSEGTFTITGYTSSTVVTVAESDTYATPRTFSIASDGTFRLPSDFDSPDSSTIGFTDSDQSGVPAIRFMNEKEITMLRAVQDQTGYPQFGCIRWRTSDGTASQGKELVTWPEPDQHYAVALPYMAKPQGMSVANPYPRGGSEMAEPLLSVILATCEEAKNGQRGDRYQQAVEICQSAVARDRTRHHNFIAGAMLADSGTTQRMFNVKRLVLPA